MNALDQTSGHAVAHGASEGLPSALEQSHTYATHRGRPVRTEPRAVRIILTVIALAFVGLFIGLPLVTVFYEAFKRGWQAYVAALVAPDALAAIQLTLIVAAISVVANLLFGLVAAWSIAKFEFPGKTFLITLIDLPFSVSPVVAGLSMCCCSARRACSPHTCRRGTSRSSSRCRASCSPPSSSPSPSWRAN